MTNPNGQTLVLFAAGLTFAVPYVSALLTQKHFPRYANEIIAFLVSAAAGVTAFLQAGGNFRSVHNAADLFPLVPAIFAGAKLYYVKLGYSSPLIPWIEWLTGGMQRGYPAPASTLSARPDNPDVDPVPASSTDAGSADSSPALTPADPAGPSDAEIAAVYAAGAEPDKEAPDA